jgi:hypothetical protein
MIYVAMETTPTKLLGIQTILGSDIVDVQSLSNRLSAESNDLIKY